jgi:hypothetical protein
MKKNLFLIVMMMWSCGVLFGQETWVKTFGGSVWDIGHSITTTPDGGFVLTGRTSSNDGDFKGMRKDKSNIFIIKLDSSVNVQWKKLFGVSSTGSGSPIITTPDGGYVLTGTTGYNDGEFEGIKKGGDDIFVIKLDSRGEILWKKTFGDKRDEWGHSITTTPDGGYVVSGRTDSNDGDFKGMNKGESDIFAIKLDSLGDVVWKKLIGGSSTEMVSSIITTTSDGGYVLTGWSNSNDGDFKGMNKGGKDILVIKLDSRGDVQWKKMFGGSSKDDYGYSITTTPDGGFVLTGRTSSNDGDFKGMNKGEMDIFVIKLDSRGDVVWKKLIGGSSTEMGTSIVATPDGGFVLTGSTYSYDGDFEGMSKCFLGDNLVIKLDSRGDVVWKKTFGGSKEDWGFSITTTPEGRYVFTGGSISNDGDFKGMNKGEMDIFVIKLDSNGNLQPSGKKSKKK